MSVFGNIMSAIFKTGSVTAAPGTPVGAFFDSSVAAGSSAAPPTAPMSEVDVEAVLMALTAKSKEKLDWRRSIVDLMKLLNLDSGLAARKELAKELNYTGDTSDSAAMNVWLHKQVMQKLAANGGKVPADLIKA